MEDVSKIEEEVILLWQKLSAFKNSIKSGEDFVFLDGPPFATGTPHYGHLLAGTIKDVICRYQTMLGRRVERKFGWDCHGLPVESLAQKNFAGKNTSVEEFNNFCESIVLGCANSWETTSSRMGRWIDFDKCYRTMDKSFMESVWWVFKKIWEQGRIYKSHRVMPYSPKLMTPISNFEAASNYREIEDPALFVKFKVNENSFILVYTTTPWTLPANMALCVNPDEEYSWIEYSKVNYLVASSLIEKLGFKNFTVISVHKGIDLVGLSYEQLFDVKVECTKAFKLLADNFVSVEDGTGIVHLAPAYGEDDYRVCNDNSISFIDVLDGSCCYNDLFLPLKGIFCKEADSKIISILNSKNMVFMSRTIIHSYPYCERTNTPLIYRAVDGWYLKVEDIKNDLLKNNKLINWVPEAIGKNRFSNWLENAKDWNISRNRLWGCCLPIWQADDGDIICIGSISELEELSGCKIENLHKHVVDKIVIYKNNKKYSRVPEVLDCWFESGCMPYGQNHYPFENKDYVENNLPADFIAEGLDQTRGWFYTLLIISTCLFNKPPFKNVIVNGLILAEDGQKMSKSKNNYTDPLILINEIGADAIRGYLCSSAAAHAESLLFNNQDAAKFNAKIVIPILNAYKFYETYPSIDGWLPNNLITSNNILDRWIISKINLLVKEVTDDLSNFTLSKICHRFIAFIDDLNNWYIRSSRKRFWEGNNLEAYSTLYCVLNIFAKTLAPIMPFVSEHIYQKINNNKKSVHWESWVVPGHIDYELLSRMDKIICTVANLQNLRNKNGIRVRQPLSCAYVNISDLSLEEKNILKEELNVKEIFPILDESAFYNFSYKGNFKTLGKKFGSTTKHVVNWISEQTEKPTSYENIPLLDEDIILLKTPKPGFVTSHDKLSSVVLDISLSEELLNEGWVRDLISQLQNFRKLSGFAITDKIYISFNSEHGNLINLILKYKDQIEKTLLASISCKSVSHRNFTYNDVYFCIFKIRHDSLGKSYLKDGKLHREDGPAYEGVNGTKEWFLNGKRHRLDGAACCYSGGNTQFYIDGMSYTKEEYNKKVKLINIQIDNSDKWKFAKSFGELKQHYIDDVYYNIDKYLSKRYWKDGQLYNDDRLKTEYSLIAKIEGKDNEYY